MGVDIHMSIVKDKKYLAKEIYDGRNSDWFANLQKEGWDDEYDYLPAIYGFPEDMPEEAKSIEKLLQEGCYYGFYHIKVEDYVDWFKKYKPYIDAGWVSTYDQWRIENKGYIPEELSHYLSNKDNIADMHFIEVEKKYDNSKWLFDYLVDNKIPNTAYIIYFFDR